MMTCKLLSLGVSLPGPGATLREKEGTGSVVPQTGRLCSPPAPDPLTGHYPCRAHLADVSPSSSRSRQAEVLKADMTGTGCSIIFHN